MKNANGLLGELRRQLHPAHPEITLIEMKDALPNWFVVIDDDFDDTLAREKFVNKLIELRKSDPKVDFGD